MKLKPQPAASAGAKSVQTPRRLTEIVSELLEALATHHRGVLESGHVEAVHKMRVTTRRLQAALDLLESPPHDRQVRALKRRARNWRRLLSLVRNYDVFLELTGKNVTMRRPANQDMYDLLQGELTGRRAQVAAEVRRKLEDIDINALATELGLKPSWGDKDEEAESLGDHLRDEKRIARRATARLQQRLNEFLAMAAAARPETEPAQLHRLRIGAKRLRYLFEILSDMGCGDAARALAWLRRLQDRIGDWHDLVAQEDEIVSIVTQPDFIHEHLKPSGKLLHAAAQMRRRRHKLAQKLFPVKVPAGLERTSRRFERALRKRAG